MFSLLSPVYKDRVAKGFSYPLGTELLSQSLQGIPQYKDLSVSFRNTEGLLMGGSSCELAQMKWKGDMSDLIPVKDLISATYSSRHSHWSILIFRVQSEHKYNARKFLLSLGLLIIRTWLEQSRPETWYNGYRRLSIGLMPNTPQYAVLETQEVNSRQIIDSFTAQLP